MAEAPVIEEKGETIEIIKLEPIKIEQNEIPVYYINKNQKYLKIFYIFMKIN